MQAILLTESELQAANALLKMAADLTNDPVFVHASENISVTRLVTPANRQAISRAVSFYSLISQKLYEILSEKFNVSIDTEFSLESYDIDQKAFAALKKRLKEKAKTPHRQLYIADCHFFHNNLNFFMDKRGFKDYEEMDQFMISQWNSHVTSKDDVYILGDFSISGGESTNEILKQLNGRKHLIIGNHDRYLEDKQFDTSLLVSIRPYAEINDNGRKVVLSHYPIFCYNGQYKKDSLTGEAKTFMLYGHVHNTHDELLVNKFIHITNETVFQQPERGSFTVPCQMINCFCMFSNYIPVTLDEWIEIDRKRRESVPLL